MKFVSFNVNSVRLRLHQLKALAESHNPDVIGLQETKVVDKDFPSAAIEELGYYCAFAGQKTHYGVALLSKYPIDDVQIGFASDQEDAQRRLISGVIHTSAGTPINVINGYFPQGEKRDHPVKFPAKEKFYADLQRKLTDEYSPESALILMGDFNIAPIDADLGIGADNVRRWLRTGATSFLPEERAWFETLCGWGLDDSYRVKYPDKDDKFSWFDYRSRGFEREPKRGLRIDHILCSRTLTPKLIDAGIDYDVRAMEKPSDHCPVWSSFQL